MQAYTFLVRKHLFQLHALCCQPDTILLFLQRSGLLAESTKVRRISAMKILQCRDQKAMAKSIQNRVLGLPCGRTLYGTHCLIVGYGAITKELIPRCASICHAAKTNA